MMSVLWLGWLMSNQVVKIAGHIFVWLIALLKIRRPVCDDCVTVCASVLLIRFVLTALCCVCSIVRVTKRPIR